MFELLTEYKENVNFVLRQDVVVLLAGIIKDYFLQ